MKDIEIKMTNTPGNLALMGETLGRHGISLEGGGVFSEGSMATAHFLVDEPELARDVLANAGFGKVVINDVVLQKLRQDVPGQLGLFCRRLADAGVNILVQYSDHSNQLVVVADDPKRAREVSDEWMREWWPS